MRRLEPGSRLVVASHNPGKVWEIRQLLAPYGLDAVSAGDLKLDEPEETESTFHGNAKLKAVAAARGAGLVALADDSGLEVDCLGGGPGIYSARWAGPAKDFGLAMRKVFEEVTARNGWAGSGPRANFISVLCLAWPDGEALFYEGKVFGRLVWPPRGGNGFGYDPMFQADGETETFGEMEPKAKYAISHRTRAFETFRRECLAAIQPAEAALPTTRDLEGLTAAAANLSTQDELSRFVANLRDDLIRHPQAWNVRELGGYLGALSIALADRRISDEPRWRALAKALLKASGG